MIIHYSTPSSITTFANIKLETHPEPKLTDEEYREKAYSHYQAIFTASYSWQEYRHCVDAIVAFKEIKDLNDKDYEHLALTYFHLGLYYFNELEFKKKTKFYLHVKQKETKFVNRVFHEFENAEKAYNNIKQKEDSQFRRFLSTLYYHRGFGYFILENRGQGETWLKRAIKKREKIGDHRTAEDFYYLARYYIELGHLLDDKSKNDEAIQYLQSAVSCSVQDVCKNFSFLIKNYFLLMKLLAEPGKRNKKDYLLFCLNYFEFFKEYFKSETCDSEFLRTDKRKKNMPVLATGYEFLESAFSEDYKNNFFRFAKKVLMGYTYFGRHQEEAAITEFINFHCPITADKKNILREALLQFMELVLYLKSENLLPDSPFSRYLSEENNYLAFSDLIRQTKELGFNLAKIENNRSLDWLYHKVQPNLLTGIKDEALPAMNAEANFLENIKEINGSLGTEKKDIVQSTYFLQLNGIFKTPVKQYGVTEYISTSCNLY